MLKNYFKIALRNLVKHKGYSFINIFGLAVGIGCCLLIFLYIKDEVSYDKYQSKIDRIYRVNSTIDWFGDKNTMGATNVIEAKEYAERIPEIEAYARYKGATVVIQKGDDWLNQYSSYYTDQATFEIFDHKSLSGSFGQALNELNSIVISKSVAEKFFNRVDVAGEELNIKLEGKIEKFIIDAVYDDYPTNSSLAAEMYFSWLKFESIRPVDPVRAWTSIGNTSIVLLSAANNNSEEVADKMNEVRVQLNSGEDQEWARNIESSLQPFVDVHLNMDIDGSNAIKNPSNPTYSYILGGIGLLILILACINFANLSVARSIPRAKEIGLRKVLGAQRKQVAFQFLGEAFYVCVIAFVLGIILAELFLPSFGQIINKEFSSGVFDDIWLLIASFAFIVITTVLAGSYPAFFVARFSILNSLTGKVKLTGRQYLTKALVLFQFAIAAILIIGTIVMNQQINFMLETDLGYDDKNLAIVNLWGNEDQASVMLAELRKNPNIEKISLSDGFNSMTSMGYGEEEFFVIYADVDTSYLNVIGLNLKDGRNLRHYEDNYARSSDTLVNMIVTQKFLDQVGIESDAIGTVINSGGGEDAEDQYRIIGVLDDFVYSNAKVGTAPIALTMGKADEGQFAQMNIRFREGYASEIETVVESAWKKIDPYTPVSFSFKEESNRNSYAEEKRWKAVITTSSVIAIIISSLGLFGMAHLSSQQRQKEIGVRKVLGATVSQLVIMLNLGFTKLVTISAIIAIPISYYFLDNWLSNFATKMELGIMVFTIPTLITLLIALSTVSIQALRTAQSNPVDSLRNE